jgi:hypothetical protein
MQTALLTLRRIRPVPWFGAFVDAEDVLVTGLGAQLHEVDLADARWARRPLASAHLHRLLAAARLTSWSCSRTTCMTSPSCRGCRDGTRVPTP